MFLEKSLKSVAGKCTRWLYIILLLPSGFSTSTVCSLFFEGFCKKENEEISTEKKKKILLNEKDCSVIDKF